MDYSTFTSYHRLFRFISIPFCLKSAPTTFQRAMDVIPSPIKWKFVIVYIDIVVFPRTIVEHQNHLRADLKLLSATGVLLMYKNCSFFDKKIDYSGQVFKPGCLGLLTNETDTVDGLRDLMNVTELKAFFGLCNVFRLFVLNSPKLQTLSIRSWRSTSHSTLKDCLRLKQKRWKRQNSACCHHQYWYWEDPTEDIRWTLMPAIRKSGASDNKTGRMDQQNLWFSGRIQRTMLRRSMKKRIDNNWPTFELFFYWDHIWKKHGSLSQRTTVLCDGSWMWRTRQEDWRDSNYKKLKKI